MYAWQLSYNAGLDEQYLNQKTVYDTTLLQTLCILVFISKLSMLDSPIPLPGAPFTNMV